MFKFSKSGVSEEKNEINSPSIEYLNENNKLEEIKENTIKYPDFQIIYQNIIIKNFKNNISSIKNTKIFKQIKT